MYFTDVVLQKPYRAGWSGSSTSTPNHLEEMAESSRVIGRPQHVLLLFNWVFDKPRRLNSIYDLLTGHKDRICKVRNISWACHAVRVLVLASLFHSRLRRLSPCHTHPRSNHCLQLYFYPRSYYRDYVYISFALFAWNSGWYTSPPRLEYVRLVVSHILRASNRLDRLDHPYESTQRTQTQSVRVTNLMGEQNHRLRR